MDRARVLSPSISFAAHFTGATLLAVVPLFLPDQLPPVASPIPDPPTLAGVVIAVNVGGHPVRSHSPRPPKVTPPRAFDAGRLAFADLKELRFDEIDLGDGRGIAGTEGIGDDVGDSTTGFCLSDCGSASERTEVEPPVHADPVRIRGGDIREPLKVRHVAPVYPQLAIAARVQGSVVIDCVIDENGNVTSLTVLRSNPLLEQAAVDAVRQWRYRPTLLNGTPVSVIMTVTVDFRLQ
jgi:protein TonB